MIKKKDIKVGSVLKIRKADLEHFVGSEFVENIDPNNTRDSINVKVVDIVDGWCEIKILKRNEFIYVDPDKLAKVSVFANEFTNKKTEQVSHPSHYAWLKDLCGVEPIEICRHFDFSIGNALKYLMRKGKADGDKTEEEKRIEDLRKAIFYINDEIKRIEGTRF